MTTPHERARAVLKTRLFLLRLSDDQDVLEAVRFEAEALLRHYPDSGHMAVMAELLPSAFEVRREQPPTEYERRYLWRVFSRGLLFSIALSASLYGLGWLVIRYNHHQ